MCDFFPLNSIAVGNSPFMMNEYSDFIYM